MNSYSYSTKQWLAATHEDKNDSFSLISKQSTFRSEKNPSTSIKSTRYSSTDIQVLRQERDTAVIQNCKLERELQDVRDEIAARQQEYDTLQENHEKQVEFILNKMEAIAEDECEEAIEGDDDDDDDEHREESLLGPVDHQLVETKDRIGDYHLTSLVGKGKFARVYKGTHTPTNQEFAIKCIDKSHIQSPKAMHQLVNELTVLTQISHTNMVSAIEVHHAPLGVYAVMELGAMDLFDYNKLHGMGDESTLREVMIGMLQPLEFLHSIGICHSDIKQENVLLMTTGDITRDHVRLCDFGLCTFSTSTDPRDPVLQQGFKGTIPLVAPQVLLEDEYDARPVDMWAVGCTLLELVHEYPPGWQLAYDLAIKHHNVLAFEAKIRNCLQILRGSTSIENHDVFDIICSLLRMDPSSRRTACRVLEHPWFDGCF